MASIILVIYACVTFERGFATLSHCAGIFALVGRAITRKFGTFDSNFAAKNFLLIIQLGFSVLLRWAQRTPISALFFIVSHFAVYF
jgi:hypothetical protein